jgi:hypothetical protein
MNDRSRESAPDLRDSSNNYCKPERPDRSRGESQTPDVTCRKAMTRDNSPSGVLCADAIWAIRHREWQRGSPFCANAGLQRASAAFPKADSRKRASLCQKCCLSSASQCCQKKLQAPQPVFAQGDPMIDLKGKLANPGVVEKFAAAFAGAYLAPAFGARSKSEIDLLVFTSLEDAGALNATAPTYDIARAFNNSPARVSTLVFNWQLRATGQGFDLKAALMEALAKTRFAKDGEYLAFGIESPTASRRDHRPAKGEGRVRRCHICPRHRSASRGRLRGVH